MPDYVFTEIEKYKADILKKSEMEESKFSLLFSLIKERLTVIPESDITHGEEAKEIMDKIDPKDTIFIALALSVKNDGIWSDDIHFEKQNKVKVWKTKDLIKFL